MAWQTPVPVAAGSEVGLRLLFWNPAVLVSGTLVCLCHDLPLGGAPHKLDLQSLWFHSDVALFPGKSASSAVVSHGCHGYGWLQSEQGLRDEGLC